MEVGDVKSAKNGTINFMPYRGSGHYQLATIIQEKGQCNAVLIQGNINQNILIYDYSKYGIVKYEKA